MSKSYWMKEQKGNFSNDKEDTFDPMKRYVGIRLQQGVPLLDRDWNELEDIRRHEEMVHRRDYLGNGSPDDGFKISADDPPANDFRIASGKCIVDGFEAVNEPEGKDYILYSDQNDVPALTSPAADGFDTVYLDVWIEEVTSAEDSALGNSQDVNVETCIRHKLDWRVRVDEGSAGYSKEEYHHYYDIARIARKKDIDTILDEDIQDMRDVLGRKALERMGHLKEILNSVINDNLPSDPEVNLTNFSNYWGGQYFLKDHAGNIWMFWYSIESGVRNLWCKKYNSFAGTWSVDTQITSGTTNKSYLNSFEDKKGNVWLFWYNQDANNIYNIWCNQYSAGSWKSTQLTSGTTTQNYLNTFEDQSGNIWLFWHDSGDNNNIWVRTYSSTDGTWGNGSKITSATVPLSFIKVFEGKSGDIWLFWHNRDANNIYNIWCNQYSAGSWKSTQLTSGTTSQYHYNSFEDQSGNIWLFWYDSGDNNNIWARVYNATSGTWENGSKITSATVPLSFIKVFEDKSGNIWLFWYNRDANNIYNIWCNQYSAGSWKSTQLTSGTTNQYHLNSFEDQSGNIWLFWYDSGDNNNIWSKMYSSTSKVWGSNMKQTSGTTPIGYRVSFEDKSGRIWLFWNSYDEGIASLWCKIYHKEWSWGVNTHLNKTAANLNYIKYFEDQSGNIWILFHAPDYNNIWCVRYYDGDWLAAKRLTTGQIRKGYRMDFIDKDGNILLFWIAYQYQQPGYIYSNMFKKVYASI